MAFLVTQKNSVLIQRSLVATPTLTSEIRGTIFTYEYNSGESRSEVGVYEGEIAIVASTEVDETQRTQLRTTIDPQSDLSPLDSVLGTGETLSVTSEDRNITIIGSNITANEYNQFQKEATGLSDKLGIGQSSMNAALNNAFGGTAQADGTASRMTTIQRTDVTTNLGKGFKLVVRTSEDGTDDDGNAGGNPYTSTETIVGVTLDDNPVPGSTTTISRNTSVALTNDGNNNFYGTVYTSETKEVVDASGNITTETTVTSQSYVGTP